MHDDRRAGNMYNAARGITKKQSGTKRLQQKEIVFMTFIVIKIAISKVTYCNIVARPFERGYLNINTKSAGIKHSFRRSSALKLIQFYAAVKSGASIRATEDSCRKHLLSDISNCW